MESIFHTAMMLLASSQNPTSEGAYFAACCWPSYQNGRTGLWLPQAPPGSSKSSRWWAVRFPPTSVFDPEGNIKWLEHIIKLVDLLVHFITTFLVDLTEGVDSTSILSPCDKNMIHVGSIKKNESPITFNLSRPFTICDVPYCPTENLGVTTGKKGYRSRLPESWTSSSLESPPPPSRPGPRYLRHLCPYQFKYFKTL